MAKTFYYDSIDLLDSTINDGTVTDSDADSLYEFSDASSITNEERIIDQSISTAATSWGQNDAVQFDLGGNKIADFLAIYSNATETGDVVLEVDTASTGESLLRLATITATLPANDWLITEFSEAARQYWRIIAASSGGLVGITEIILGKKLAFEVNPDIGIAEQEIFGTDINTSIGGVEYAIKRHDPKSTISMNFSNISETFKNNLQTFESHVQNYKKFVYSEDGTTGNFHYVRLDAPIQFQEVAYQRYSASLILREQLS